MTKCLKAKFVPAFYLYWKDATGKFATFDHSNVMLRS